MSVEHLREHYEWGTLTESDVLEDPMQQFKKWFDEAVEHQIKEPNAMVISTVDPQGQPSARTILCKGIESDGLRFYTNYESRKGHDLEKNPHVSALFVWLPIERQVHFMGRVVKLTEQQSDAYFNSRPLASRIGAWASPQSQVITREELEARESTFQEKFGHQVPRPKHWGGYLIVPEQIEFWQGRPSRLHDRIVYQRQGESWKIVRLAP